jgi:hypothetical protein
MYTPVWMCESCKVDLITPEIGIVQGLVVIHTHKNTLQYKWQGGTVYGEPVFLCHTDMCVSTV